MQERLTKSDWLVHGLKTLATEGKGALRVGAMAEGLNVSRGSFYWHFRDISDFHALLLQRWLEETTEQVIHQIEEEEPGPDRLKALLIGAFIVTPQLDRETGPWAAEDAIRSWAAEDESVAAMVASVDDRRITYIAEMLNAAGVDRRKACSRAALLYWAYLGRSRVMDARHTTVEEAGIDDILRLFLTGS